MVNVPGGNARRHRLPSDGARQIAQPLSLAIGIRNNAFAKTALLKLKRN